MPDPTRSKTTIGTWHCWLAPAAKPGAAGKWEMAWPQEKTIALVTTDKGYNLEMAIPLRIVNTKQQKPWEAVRLNITMFDQDGPQGGTAIFWQPNWGWSPVSKYPGSGTFVKTDDRKPKTENR